MAQTYDRDLADVFAIQSEIAKTIADQLQAKLSPREENAIQRSPTSDISAFDLYARAKNILLREGSSGKADYLQAIDLLTQAIARDPSFFDAYCQLAFAHDGLYFFGDDHTSARLALAEAALQAASRLRPDAGETHLARGRNLYWAYGDYDGALAELEVARQTLPNDARIFGLTGIIQRRQGRWEESTRNLERAVELTRAILTCWSWGFRGITGFVGAMRKQNRGPPAHWLFNLTIALRKYGLRTSTLIGKPIPDRCIKQSIQFGPQILPRCRYRYFWLVCALAERDAAAAKDALMAFGEEHPSLLPIMFVLIVHLQKASLLV